MCGSTRRGTSGDAIDVCRVWLAALRLPRGLAALVGTRYFVVVSKSPRRRRGKASAHRDGPTTTRRGWPAASSDASASAAARILDAVRSIPVGRVATYGEVAEIAGVFRGHRVAASALRQCPSDVPWHRVLAKHDPKRARIALPDEAGALQRALLEAEGVTLDAHQRVSLVDFGWLPR